MNKPTYCITGIAQMPGIGKNKTVNFNIYESNAPIIGSHYYSRELDVGIYVTKVEALESR